MTDLSDLLALLDIEHVIVIDDQFTPPPSMYTLGFAPGEGPELEGLPPLPDGADYEDHVAQHWPDVPIAAKLAVRAEALKAPDFVDPTGDPTNVKALVPGLQFTGMTLHEWEAAEAAVLARPGRCLILFDVNFGAETGDDDDEAGLAPAGKAMSKGGHHVVGLLTTRTARGGEDASADTWAPRADVPRADLVVVNKTLLADLDNDADLATAIEQVRTTLQAAQLSTLRGKVRESLQSALDETAKQLAGNASGILEDLVFKASRDGGEWEGDTWFRLYTTLGVTRAKRGVAADPTARRAIQDVRNLIHHRGAAAHADSAALAAQVQEAETYEGPEHLNRAGLPIANGDIFATAAGAMFVLIGQPCDLMVYPGGRAYDPQTATLLPIKKRRSADEPSAYRLPASALLGEGLFEVRFRSEEHVSFDVLDLVSFNTQGVAALAPPKKSGLSPLLPGLQGRFDAITARANKLAAPLATIDKLFADKQVSRDRAIQLRRALLYDGGPFKPTLKGKPTPFAFDCRRIGRLSGSYADALLAAHSGARSRTAHAHELTRIVADETPADAEAD